VHECILVVNGRIYSAFSGVAWRHWRRGDGGGLGSTASLAGLTKSFLRRNLKGQSKHFSIEGWALFGNTLYIVRALRSVRLVPKKGITMLVK
jgi:hypothetical protein